MAWKGVVIEESLKDRSLLRMARIVRTRKDTLEGEDERGEMTLHYIEVDDRDKEKFLEKAKSAIKDAWYLHICKDGTMAVVFRGRVFEFTAREPGKIREAEDYGESMGILREQMNFRGMIDEPWA